MVDFMVRFRTGTKLSPSFDDVTQARGSCVSEKNLRALVFRIRRFPIEHLCLEAHASHLRERSLFSPAKSGILDQTCNKVVIEGIGMTSHT